MMGMRGIGIWGVIVLIADIYAILNITGSQETPLNKAVWIVVILLLPVLGFVIWWLAGPKSSR